MDVEIIIVAWYKRGSRGAAHADNQCIVITEIPC